MAPSIEYSSEMRSTYGSERGLIPDSRGGATIRHEYLPPIYPTFVTDSFEIHRCQFSCSDM
jgi:hypothetical protein